VAGGGRAEVDGCGWSQMAKQSKIKEPYPTAAKPITLLRSCADEVGGGQEMGEEVYDLLRRVSNLTEHWCFDALNHTYLKYLWCILF